MSLLQPSFLLGNMHPTWEAANLEQDQIWRGREELPHINMQAHTHRFTSPSVEPLLTSYLHFSRGEMWNRSKTKTRVS